MFRKNFDWVALVATLALCFSLIAGCVPAPTTSPAQPTEKPAATPAPADTQAPAPTKAPENTLAPTSPPPTESPKSQIVIAIAEDPPSFNASVDDTGYDALVMELVMLGLSDLDPEGNVFPELASELPTVENGQVVLDEDNGTMDVTWNLRTDVSWADGQPVTADDVIFTYEALIDPEKGLWIPGIDYVDGIDKIDEHSFVIHYNTIYPGYLLQFGGEQMVIWPAHYCDAEQGFAQWDCAQNPLSNGPYILQEWVLGDHMTFVRNPNYFEKGKPAIETIFVRVVPDESVRKTMLVNGDADVLMWATEAIIADLANNGNVQVSTAPTNRWVMRLFFNLAARGTTDAAASPHPILSDVRVRQAIHQAIDVEVISREIFMGYSTAVWTEFFRPPYQCSVPKPVYDPDAAAVLLEQAGWTDQNDDGVRECHACQTAEEGYPMEMELITYAEYGEPLELTQQLIAEMLGAVGIKLKLTIVEGSVLWATFEDGGIEQTGDFDITMWDDGYPGIDPSDFLWELYYSEAAEPDVGWNISRWINPDMDALIDESYTLDLATRQDLFCQMATILDQEVPSILLFTTVNADAYSIRIQGIQSTTNDLVTWNVADWTIK
ncbi:MAG: peptide ABC transporter substrate-binding protein [Chloroflexota bacterium]